MYFLRNPCHIIFRSKVFLFSIFIINILFVTVSSDSKNPF